MIFKNNIIIIIITIIIIFVWKTSGWFNIRDLSI